MARELRVLLLLCGRSLRAPALAAVPRGEGSRAAGGPPLTSRAGFHFRGARGGSGRLTRHTRGER